MKKVWALVFSIIISISCIINTDAKEYTPRYVNSIKNVGMGVFLPSDKITIYSKPDENSEVLLEFSLKELAKNDSDDIIPVNTFIAFDKDFKNVFFTVADETPDWCEVFFDHKNKRSGWIKKTEGSNFFTWKEFFDIYGRNKGIRFFTDVPTEYKAIYTSPSDDAQQITGFYHPKEMELKLIRGNWMLIKLINFDRTAQIGWIKWRKPDGTLLVFPNLY